MEDNVIPSIAFIMEKPRKRSHQQKIIDGENLVFDCIKKKTLEVIKARLAFQATVREKFRGFTVAWILEMERIDAKRKLLRNGSLKLSHGILRRHKDTWSMLMED